MNPGRKDQVNAMFNAAMALPADQRDAYLQVQCRRDTDLLDEVRSLLQAQDDTRGFLDTPAGASDTVLSEREGHSEDQFVGQEVDGYQILDVLGQGGMGVVYKAKNLTLNRIEALKVISPLLVSNAPVLHRFKVEAQALAQIQHPNIVTIYTLRQSRLGHYITMEYAQGQTLADALAEQRTIPWEQAVPLIKQLLAALDYAHERGILHRDIKPRNIMLTPGGGVKVMDFGLAKFYLQQDQTLTQGVSGSLFYMSPEQIKGQKLDQRSDLFALGMTTYEMLSGRLPFDKGGSQYSIQRAITEDDFLAPRHFNSAVPAGLSKIIMHALEKSPKQRFQHAEEMLDAVEAFEKAVIVSQAPTIEFAQPDRSKRTINKRFVWLGVTGLLIAAVLGSLLLWTDVPLAPAQTTLSITTTPTGATISLNGENIGLTPLPDYPIDTRGKDEGDFLEVRKEGFFPIDTTLYLEKGQLASLNFLLDEDTETIGSTLFAAVNITSVPDGAIVWISDNQVGRTPYTDPQMQPGPYDVRLEKEGYQSWRRDVSLEAGKETVLDPTLQPEMLPPRLEKGTLTVLGISEGVIFIDNEPLDPSGAEELDPGLHTVRCGEDPYAAEISVELSASETQELTCHFRHDILIKVETDDGSSALANVLIDDVNVGLVPGPGERISRKPGTYHIRVSQEGYDMVGEPQTVTVQPAFELQTYSRTFQITTTAPPPLTIQERVLKEAAELEVKIEEAMRRGSWSDLPGPLAEYFQGMASSQTYNRFDIVGGSVEIKTAGLLVDGTTAILPVEYRFDLIQSGREIKTGSPAIPSTWTWSIEQDILTLVGALDLQ